MSVSAFYEKFVDVREITIETSLPFKTLLYRIDFSLKASINVVATVLFSRLDLLSHSKVTTVSRHIPDEF